MFIFFYDNVSCTSQQQIHVAWQISVGYFSHKLNKPKFSEGRVNLVQRKTI